MELIMAKIVMNPVYLSRRNFLGQAAAAVGTFGASAMPRTVSAAESELVPNEVGGYRFLPGLPFASLGAIAVDGFEIVRATFRPPRPYPAGLNDIESHLRTVSRPSQALCSLELRSAHIYTREEFAEFNNGYVKRMGEAGLLVSERVPFTRVNVVVAGNGAAQTIHAFSYTMPALRRTYPQTPTFVLAAAPEIRFAPGGREGEIIAPGDTSAEGLRRKTAFVLEVLSGWLQALQVQWSDTTNVRFYSLHDAHSALISAMLSKLREAGLAGIQLIFARPPVDYVDIEIDARSTRAEVIVEG
jgi:hypothetical protein